jgi:hypothetical protein
MRLEAVKGWLALTRHPAAILVGSARRRHTFIVLCLSQNVSAPAPRGCGTLGGYGGCVQQGFGGGSSGVKQAFGRRLARK